MQLTNMQYKAIPLFAGLYFTISIFITIMTNKLIVTPVGIIPTAAFLSPFWFLLGDIIAEIYGYKISMRLFLSCVICEFLFTSICYLLASIPSPINWQWNNDYHFLFKYLLNEHLWETLAIIVAWRLNANLITKWKALTQGKYFWLRSLGASAIGESLFSLLMLPSWLLLESNVHVEEAIMLFLWMITLRIFLIGVFTFPASIVVKIMKVVENNYSSENKFNPFHVFYR